MKYRGKWSECETYEVNDVVTFLNSSYVSLVCNNEDSPTEDESWGLIAKDGDINYKGDWDHYEEYERGEVVLYQGSTYISLVCNNEANPTDESKWGLMAKKGVGFEFEGDWEDCEEYDKNDIVYYHGSSYVSKNCNNSAVPTDESAWSLMAKKGEAAEFKGDWEHCKEYDINDIVYYHGSSYVSKNCDNTARPTDESAWHLVAAQSKIQYQGEWDDCHSYELGDVVEFRGSSYVSLVCDNEACPTDDTKWGILSSKGDSVLFKGEWRGCDVYGKGDIVYFHGSSYVSLACENEDEPTNTSKWGLLAKEGSINYKGNWDECTTYEKGEVVVYKGSSYVSKVCNNTSEPTDECKWGLLALRGTSMNFQRAWEDCTTYEKYAVVTYRGSCYISLVCNNEANPTDDSKWSVVALGASSLSYEGRWNCETTYGKGDIVYHNGSSYVSLVCDNTSELTDTCKWALFAKSGEMKFLGEWDHCEIYGKGDVVSYRGSSYVSLQEENEANPTDECK